jgi:SsrA-binding protein
MKIIATNRRAKFDYELKEKFEAGLVLTGSEVKSIKAGHIDLKGSYISFRGQEAYLVKAHVSPYKQAMNLDSYDPESERKLLLHKSELNRIIEDSKSQHLTIVPTAIGLSRGRIKLEIALARGKKLYDKREDKKRKSMLRDARLENTQ